MAVYEKLYLVNQSEKHMFRRVLVNLLKTSEKMWSVTLKRTRPFCRSFHLHNLMNPIHCNAIPSAPGT